MIGEQISQSQIVVSQALKMEKELHDVKSMRAPVILVTGLKNLTSTSK